MQLDLTRPNTGRMLDYWLDGNHNFETDRLLADQVSKKFPLVKQLTFETRALVGRGVEYFHARGIYSIIDFGSALPTCNNTHQMAALLDPRIKVVYSDIDPVTVAYGQQLVEGNPSAIYLQCDATAPNSLLDSPLVREFLNAERHVGFLFLNLAHSMNDDKVRTAWQALYDWAAPGSLLFTNNVSENWKTDPDLIEVAEIYGSANLPGFFRNPAELRNLAQPWQVTPEGILRHTLWIDPHAPASRLLMYAMMLSK